MCPDDRSRAARPTAPLGDAYLGGDVSTTAVKLVPATRTVTSRRVVLSLGAGQRREGNDALVQPRVGVHVRGHGAGGPSVTLAEGATDYVVEDADRAGRCVGISSSTIATPE